DKASGAEIGTVSEEQLRILFDQLEEESASDDDYYINRETVYMLEQEGADAGLIGLLRQAMGERDDMDIRWARV
ncbi:MAG TPA: galactosyldiacylglycerol synthase, partial [Thermoanaerobaculia bacterium]|nr:galactosyldiacylglycerol synthase [Thermoanaerobaculia bacterium]